eukprot:CAMPEP_0197189014 /NCGR_PEP_ID=MMETSP1423-20130617/18991_1 /TAXON_ID=476441 /ORGANISM="Pseudo-nitzschia heimii, Strain UNC1101" /LENGTH=63 /DNA_ID=CAMNT_0042641023 /DNA_START=20 /DNA_END=208 /DNA_ORIENTATION=-
MTTDNDDDEFGDSSFLDDFDVDAVVASQSTPAKRLPSVATIDKVGDASLTKDFDVDAVIENSP